MCFIPIILRVAFEKIDGTEMEKTKQGRIHGYPSRLRVGRGIDGGDQLSIWAEAVSPNSSKSPKK